MLTAFDAQIRITCDGALAVVEASAGAARANVRAPMSQATLVDDVLAGVDQALEQLRSSRTKPSPPEPEPRAVPAAPVARAPASSTPPPRTPEPLALPVVKGGRPRARHFTLVSVAAGMEAWSRRAAGGGVIAARRGRAPFWLGVDASVFRPLSQDPRFEVTELSLAATVTLEPAFGHGLCLTLQAGPSWLWTVPDPALAVRSHTLSAAFVAGAQLSWQIWRGRTGVMPGFGVRWFPMERGVRLDQLERFALEGLAPHIAFALVRRLD
jgi:hypothetical protein